MIARSYYAVRLWQSTIKRPKCNHLAVKCNHENTKTRKRNRAFCFDRELVGAYGSVYAKPLTLDHLRRGLRCAVVLFSRTCRGRWTKSVQPALLLLPRQRARSRPGSRSFSRDVAGASS